ncbi:hypothetical protein, variant 2 [Blastomyces dermatitidis ER-3]|uniref:Uncharacterized protein n=2 Tax=Ajellomyces dermatitidis TaxID=5039 RepID=A0A0J9HG45_AJEDA|nr:uncharacterized protein BDCG_09267 [Blastomyces dermatitidis ER-3]XP_045282870.1 hypothetical protein, variant 1 [Blastomyces dermatitidis ER-3]XP_045282871.1 hypothetical protein, variant 2 [Blastomyces dermatitidis ER-3]EQL29516.1 hypothetical protein BDFG_07833 [Blastomyces dermatitidis ATCC 26199]KMW68044.1 hypothetical protein BDDG_12540 [Blastomyces dermatitidis ATCC 18188]EQL29517.1 hypothetical protein, variant 1 [Blastomyces dermatitidis ATCC 26199]EQL29518.1 hypothetical protein,
MVQCRAWLKYATIYTSMTLNEQEDTMDKFNLGKVAGRKVLLPTGSSTGAQNDLNRPIKTSVAFRGFKDTTGIYQ